MRAVLGSGVITAKWRFVFKRAICSGNKSDETRSEISNNQTFVSQSKLHIPRHIRQGSDGGVVAAACSAWFPQHRGLAVAGGSSSNASQAWRRPRSLAAAQAALHSCVDHQGTQQPSSLRLQRAVPPSASIAKKAILIGVFAVTGRFSIVSVPRSRGSPLKCAPWHVNLCWGEAIRTQ